MSKNRYINTRFWNDSYIADLGTEEKLLFLYFLTNSSTNISGVYEIPLRNVALETGIEKAEVEEMLERFSKDGKILYIDGWVVITNFIKHQKQGSPLVIKGIANELQQVPEKIKGYLKGIEGFEALSHLNSYPNLNSDLDGKTGDKSPATPIFERRIREKDEEYRDLVKDLAAKDYLTAAKIHDIMLSEFLPYWLERGQTARKARWEKEKVFDYLRRVRTWIKNYHRNDIQCAGAGIWHRKGESCHHTGQELAYKHLPASSLAKDLAATKRVGA